jgi:L-iditol 2-dehydrogenase
MKAAVYDKDELFKIEKIDKPELSSAGAIIKVLGCGLCGSDIVKMKTWQSLSANLTCTKKAKNGSPQGDIAPTVLGHEVVGEIIELKTEVKEFKIGDIVALGHHVPCFECVFCKNQNYSMCKTFKKTNIFPGGFCEYIFASEEHLKNTVMKVPENITLLDASFVEPAACCLRAVKRANVKKHDKVIILGLGSIGLLIGQIAKYFGADVTGCDLKDERLELAQKKGFDRIIKFENNEVSAEKYKDMTDSFGADFVFLAAGASSSVDFSLNCVRDGGTILVFSSVSSSKTAFPNNEIYYRELSVMGSYSPSPVDLKQAMTMITEGALDFKEIPTVYDLENINQAISDTLNGKILKAYIRIAG